MDSSEILINIRKIVRSINLESKRIQKEYGVSIPQLLTLTHLKNCPEYQSTHKDIISLLALNSSTVTGILNRLEKKGLVARLAKRNDKRVTYIALTSNGEKLLQDTPTLLHSKLEKKLAKLSTPDLKILESTLATLVDLLDIEDLDASPMITLEDPLSTES